jgi:hypothetical protein
MTRKRMIAGIAVVLGVAIGVPATAAFAMSDGRHPRSEPATPSSPVVSTDPVDSSSSLPEPPPTFAQAGATPITLDPPKPGDPSAAPPPLPIPPHLRRVRTDPPAQADPDPASGPVSGPPSEPVSEQPPPPPMVSLDPLDTVDR